MSLTKNGYTVHFACLTHTGNVREMNQDCYCLPGSPLSFSTNSPASLTTNSSSSLTSNEGTINSGYADCESYPVFAVFDGMGGERHGEIASRIAASVLDTRVGDIVFSQSVPADLSRICQEMNEAVCKYSADNNIRRMGTTAAILVFDDDYVYVCNVGDSRIYLLDGHNNSVVGTANEPGIVMMSHDHSQIGSHSKKPQLTQYIGVPPTEFIIEPHMATVSLAKGNRWLLCSDGLTDLVSDNLLAQILLSKSDTTGCAGLLLDYALAAGGFDNTTVIVCDIEGG